MFISETYGLGSSLLKVRPGRYKVVWKDSERRRNKAMQLHWNTAIHHEGYLYGYSGRHSRGCELRCVELRTGKVVWSQRVDERGSLLYADGHFISLGEFGTLTLIRPTPERFDLISTGFANSPTNMAKNGLDTRRGRHRFSQMGFYTSVEKIGWFAWI